ncbi:MAG: 4-hydroxy-3-methylbut-2-enyl diphosphate reductase [Prevotellaceae bacterium]|jgi:4-hydroxy-3-methylbut-2-enyl diphosphate reductase|nr:4-hydroxy-3-methylbut-2-enyl diphosphate reductase [Prevotellaceae bacterium]
MVLQSVKKTKRGVTLPPASLILCSIHYVYIEIDHKSGFCYGVVRAIQTAEQMLDAGELFSLGEIVHNDRELDRLKKKGLQVLSYDGLATLRDKKVLIRAHGEPPETYRTARDRRLTIVDCTCPVVLKLQERIKACYAELKTQNGQLLIFGKRGHAEVNGLIGQLGGDALVVENVAQLDAVDFSRPVRLFSQTTNSPQAFRALCEAVKARMHPGVSFEASNTICGQVAGRQPQLAAFAARHDVVLFVSGRKSSNGQVLFAACRSANPRSYLIEDAGEIEAGWFTACRSVGVCGATSTPKWLMEEVAATVANREDIP